MSIHVHLKPEVTGTEGFEFGPNQRGDCRIGSVGVSQTNGRFYHILQNEGDQIPEILVPFAQGVTLYTDVPTRKLVRELGIYRTEGAEATVEFMNEAGNYYKVRATGKTPEDVRNLLQAFKAGTIRPEISYEAPQGGLSRQELEEELGKRTLQLLRAAQTETRLRDELQLSMNTFEEYRQRASGACEKNANLRVLAQCIEEQFWPYCNKKRVASEILAILDAPATGQ